MNKEKRASEQWDIEDSMENDGGIGIVELIISLITVIILTCIFRSELVDAATNIFSFFC